MLNPKYSLLAVVLTIILITFLAYASQIFVLELDTRQFYIFNTLVGCIWITYARCMFTDPGGVPDKWQPSWQKLETFGEGSDDEDGVIGDGDGEGSSSDGEGGEEMKVVREQVRPDREGRIWGNADCRWCKRCKRWKPARAHHCKTCQKCTLLMDHHCPWTFNCVGYRTWPHFIRFLSFVIASCTYLEKFLVQKCLEVYRSRDLPAYLGPSLQELLLLIVLVLVNTLTDFAIIVLWIRIIANIAEGYTTIESWEQERHSTLVRRKVVRKQMFPFDISFYNNICLFMDGGILTWWCPILPNRKIGEGRAYGGGLRFEVNGFEKTWLTWPPPDPEKFGIQERRHQQRELENGPWTRGEYDVSDVSAFRRRQREDMKRFRRDPESDEDSVDEQQRVRVEEDLLDSYLDTGYGGTIADTYYDERKRQEQIQRKWRNEDGETLADYGVDEEADMLDDEDSVPLAELLRRRREKDTLMSSSSKYM
ncbi:Palmitoyltransferase [Orbilia ellipsospora]|uniref:Palmitoyltransferase PFA4 n=1 Tax=Orbilia ellipsospora TaxID=2528407 RepID=A0AAV9XHZ7_9PEZI